MRQPAIPSFIGNLTDVEFRGLKTNIDLPMVSDKINLIFEQGSFELLSLEGNALPIH